MVKPLVGFWLRMYCDANSWRWPLFKFLKPKNWEELTPGAKHKVKRHRFMIWLIKTMTTEKQRSRAWWIYELGRTESQWNTWWDEKNKQHEARG